jgi:hypothetical protein
MDAEKWKKEKFKVRLSAFLTSVITALAVLIPMWVFGVKNPGIENISAAFITITTAALAIIFAVIAIKDNPDYEKFAIPGFSSSVALFTSIFTYCYCYVNFDISPLIIITFSLSVFSTFWAISSISVMYFEIKNPF